MSKEVSNEYMQPKKCWLPHKAFGKRAENKDDNCTTIRPKTWLNLLSQSVAVCPPFLTTESPVVALWRWSWGDTMVCCEHVMQRRGDWPSFHNCYSFCGVFASRPPLAMLHHPLLPILLLAQRSGGPSRRGEITLADAQTDSSAPVNKRGLCATVTSH